MNNEMTTTNNQLTIPVETNATLLDMRLDAKRFPRLRTLPREQAIMEMKKVVYMAHLYKGQKVDPVNIDFISTALVDELMTERDYHASNISMAEVAKIVKDAVLGGSEMFGLSVSSIYAVIMTYIKTEGNRLQREVQEIQSKRRQQILESSPVNTMIQAYTGRMLNNSKSK